MIICVKQPKLDKVNDAFFRIIAVSNDADFGESNVFNMTELLPPADLFMLYNSGELSKKKFLKKYAKHIKTKNTNIEYTIFSIGMAIKNGSNICFTANDKEYRIGYVKVLANYISELFGVEIVELEDAKQSLKYALDSYSKDERKLIKKDDDDLSEKKLKLKKKFIKRINKDISDGITENEAYDTMDRKFAIDQLAMVLIKSEAVKVDKKTNTFKDIDISVLKGSKKKNEVCSPWISSIFVASEESKQVKKICKSVFESHDVKFKKKACKKMDPVAFLSLYGEIYAKLLILRSGVEE